MLQNLPEAIDFHLPIWYNGAFTTQETEKIKLSGDEEELYRQLVCWCCVQRYWYYVLDSPKASDTEYDMIERCVAYIEEEFLLERNRYSPTIRPGSSFPSDYPKFVLFCFATPKESENENE